MSLKIFWFKFLPLAVALVAVTGCGSVKLGGVHITVMEISPVAVAAEKPAVQLKLSYTNENVLPLAVAETRHKLYLNGSYLGESRSVKPIGLPSTGLSTETVTLALDGADKLAALGKAGSGNYRLESVLILEAGEDEEVKIKTASSGVLNLSAFRR